MIISRDILEAFKKWKISAERKPILIKGARQIGKTWVMEEFGRQCYEHYVKFDFDEQQELASVFQTTKDPHRIIKELESLKGECSDLCEGLNILNSDFSSKITQMKQANQVNITKEAKAYIEEQSTAKASVSVTIWKPKAERLLLA